MTPVQNEEKSMSATSRLTPARSASRTCTRPKWSSRTASNPSATVCGRLDTHSKGGLRASLFTSAPTLFFERWLWLSASRKAVGSSSAVDRSRQKCKTACLFVGLTPSQLVFTADRTNPSPPDGQPCSSLPLALALVAGSIRPEPACAGSDREEGRRGYWSLEEGGCEISDASATCLAG